MLTTIPCIWNSRREELTVSTTVAAVAAAIALGTVVATTAVEATAAAAVGAFRGLVNTDDAAVESDFVNILLHTMADRIGGAKKKKKRKVKKESSLLVVHGVHGSVGILLAGEANETETAAAASVAVLDDNLERVSEEN